MLNLDKLNSQFDISKLDAAQITKILADHQKTIKLIFVVGTLVVVGVMFNAHRIKESAMRLQISQEQAKTGVIKARDAAIHNFSDFQSSVPKEINEFQLITQISNDANSCHVTIASLNPADKKNMGLYDATNVSFTVVSDNFKDMMIFLRKIEQSDPPLMINTWSGHEGEDGKISFDMEISAVHIHP